ncbi:MAG: NADH-quinone oxidoreductase subunit L [Kofleriaceae bacterium]
MSSGELISLLPLLLASLVPASFVVAAFLISRQRSRVLTIAVVVTSIAAVLCYLAVALHPVLELLGYKAEDTGSGLTHVVQLGLPTSCMFVLVSTLGLVVVRYARTYLAGQKELDRFARAILLTLGSVSVLVTTNHLAVLVVAWFATDVGLHQLLTFFRHRRQAIIVAHKKFLLSRLADACFVSSIVLIGGQFDSLDIDYINLHAYMTPTVHIATTLLVVGVLLKSAQIPFHGWMQAVMEAPTPVSALLHAGVVNIGGFVMIRLAPLMAHAYVAQSVLLAVGLLTTIVAALVMTSRVAIKGVLAWSTIGQMGFMLVQCGLGAWHLALMHLLAHSLYKAHTFLSSGSIVQQWRANHIIHAHAARLWHHLAGAILAFAAIAPFYAATALPTGHLPEAIGPLALILGLSFAPMIGRGIAAGRRAFTISILFAVGASAAYFGWHIVFEYIAPQVNAGMEASSTKWAIVTIGCGILFLTQSILQTSPSGWFANWVQPHLVSGLYIDDWFTRVTFRLWPPGFR